MRHFLNLLPLSGEEIQHLLTRAAVLKQALANNQNPDFLRNKVVALIFEKPSLRTRVSFESGVAQLGGSSLFISGAEVGLGTRESLPDIARTMSQYVNAIVMRVFKQTTVETIAEYSTCPVINGLSDISHPCQALADLLTIQECFSSIKGRTIVFVGDGNNVARSLAIGCVLLGAKFILNCPAGYGFDPDFLERFRQKLGSIPEEVRDPAEAVRSADVIYSDVWTSMGQEAERLERLEKFKPYQVNNALLKRAPKTVKFLHCLPAHRDEEVTDEVMEGPASVVFQQAGNRLHVQKAVMEWLLR